MVSTTDAQPWDTIVPIYEQILRHCAPLKYPRPWNFVPAPAHSVGPIADPSAALAELHARLGEGPLRAAGILRTAGKDGPQLSSLFTSPTSALIALRNPHDGPLVGLLTSPSSSSAIAISASSNWTSR
jgi:hypothetical protein